MSIEAEVEHGIDTRAISTKEKVLKRSREEDRENVNPDLYRHVEAGSYPLKRALDLFLGFMGLVGFLAITPFIAIGIKLSSKGPILFKQPRMGKEGQSFDCFKFRTMHLLTKSSVDGKPVVTQKGDSRIFSFGQFLRKTNLDELPQLINVMKGEMSLVGPRPYTLNECTYWHQKFDDHYFRYMLKPGITGFAQAQGYRGGTLDDDLMRKRLDFDLIYVEKASLKFDLRIIYKTVKRMVWRDTNGH
jgi:lipopolysaccharide/colanic/teichoic acid biosynthesis glycosyltransferase